MRRLLLAAVLLAASPAGTRDDGWPAAGGDARRSGFTAQSLPLPMDVRWIYQAPHPPRPAWPASDRLGFDRAYHPVVSMGTLAFGSSADDKVYALDAATGRPRWTFMTGGPVRFAPAAWKDRLFVASDDGHLYCLGTADGRLLWKKRGGPDGAMVLGNDRMISRWPARGGPVVADDVVYWGAGIWPSEGVTLYALDAASGRVLWVNDKSGSISLAQPHRGANAVSGVAAHGYLVVDGERLLVPTGRAVPAAFRRSDGQFLYFHLQKYGQKGGAAVLSTGSAFFNGGLLFDGSTGAQLEVVGPGALALSAEGVVRSSEKDLAVARFADRQKADAGGPVLRYRGLEAAYTVPDLPGGAAVVAAGRTLVVGGPGRVSVVDDAERKVVWSTEVEGTPYGLAVAGGRLYASTDRGRLYCFGGGAPGRPVLLKPERRDAPYGENALHAAAAQEILRKTGIAEGYAVDLGCGDGALSYELASRSRLQVIAVDPDPDKVALARQRLDAAGLYGVRVAVCQADPARLPFPKNFSNLVVSARSVTEGAGPGPAGEVERVQRPFGGAACLGKPGQMRAAVRGRLEGAGQWTHLYADPANTSCSSDGLVKAPLAMSWFRDADFEMPQRHGRGPAPLFMEGRLFVEGLHGVRAIDAYNGRTLWETPVREVLKPYHGEHLMGTSGTHGNFCVTPDSLYVRTPGQCLRIDPATGKRLGAFSAPARPDGKPATWGYVACEDGILFGSLADTGHVVRWCYQKGDMNEQFTESVSFFAMDALSGALKWTRPAAHSIRHNAVAVGGGRVYLIDRPVAPGDRLDAARDKVREHPQGQMVALTAGGGKVLWESTEGVYGTLLALSVRHDALLMAYQPTSFRLPSEVGGRMSVYRASDGKLLWDRKGLKYNTRPVIVDRTVCAGGFACDLLTGDDRPFVFKRSHGCGQMAASTHLLVFRSATLAYYDLLRGEGIVDYGGIRPGCWINALPAGGMVLMPDASSGCKCSYLNQASIGLEGK